MLPFRTILCRKYTYTSRNLFAAEFMQAQFNENNTGLPVGCRNCNCNCNCNCNSFALLVYFTTYLLLLYVIYHIPSWIMSMYYSLGYKSLHKGDHIRQREMCFSIWRNNSRCCRTIVDIYICSHVIHSLVVWKQCNISRHKFSGIRIVIESVAPW
jgi:hypothetical protein